MDDVAAAIKAYPKFTAIGPIQPDTAQEKFTDIRPIQPDTAQQRQQTVPIPPGAKFDWFAAHAPKTAAQSGYTIEPPLNRASRQGQYSAADLAESPPAGWTPVFETRKSGEFDKIADPDAEITVDAKNADYADPIKAVNADKTGAISSIELTTGERVHREPDTFKAHLALAASLLLPFCYPVIGFLVPWGAIRACVWVGSGFFAPPRVPSPRKQDGV
jgi:hypothetical protein